MHKSLPFAADAWTAFQKFCGRPGAFFLDSSRRGGQAGHSYIGFSPFKTFCGADLRVLKNALRKYRRPPAACGFSGGAVGYLSYEGSCQFGLYDRVLAFDHAQKRLTIHAPDKRGIDDIRGTLASGGPAPPARPIRPPRKALRFTGNFTKASYMAAVKKALGHIRQGDIYQINLSRRIDLEVDWQKRTRPEHIYGALRRRAPSPFAAYFDAGDRIILSSSPERFVRLCGRTAQVKPMKGTRPRGPTPARDGRLRRQLLNSPKEIAELLMVTDLERNDLGRVCEYGSVKVKAMRTIEAYKTVFQATATVEGVLRKDQGPVDLLQAAFPSGSVTGCPKIEAMKIIKKLENAPRGPYTGVLGYIDFNGNMDFSVLIRAIFLRPGRASFHVGGGIVADSRPAAEYEETCVKARALQEALQEVLYV